MALATNITRRSGSKHYYLRVAIPKDLQGVVKRRELWKSLETAEPSEAKRRARIEMIKIDAEWEEIRQRSLITDAHIEVAIWNRYQELVERDENFRSELLTEEELKIIWKELEREYGSNNTDSLGIMRIIEENYEEYLRERRDRTETLRRSLVNIDYKAVLSAAIDGAKNVGISSVDFHSPAFKKLMRGMLRAELEALNRAEERDRGDYTGAPKDPIISAPIGVIRPAVKRGETIIGLYERFKKEKIGSATEDTWNQSEKVIQLLAEFIGTSEHISNLDRKRIRDFKTNLFEWPVKAAEIKEFSGLKFLDVIKKNEKLAKPTISEKTINRYLSAIGSYARWLLANDYISEDIMSGMYLSIDKTTKKVFPYSVEQLKKIFSSPLFIGCESDASVSIPGDFIIRDWRYWIPLIALYSGARLGEICQLYCTDVRVISDVLCFHITTAGDEAGVKSTKTEGSERVIPVHSALLDLGFADKYLSEVKNGGNRQLFPELKKDARGFWSGDASGFFNKYFDLIGVKEGRKYNFHSFRHNVTDEFRMAGFLDEQFAPLLGHTKSTTTQRYGILTQLNLEARVRMVEALRYPALDLEVLRRGVVV